MRMSEAHMLATGIGRVGEIYAVTVDSLINLVVPRLEGGITVINTKPAGTTSGSPPPLPAIFKGNLNLGNTPMDVGTRVYAKVSMPGQTDVWVSTVLSSTGRYVLTLGAPTNSFNNGVVEFWLLKRRHLLTSTYVAGRTLEFPLNF